MIGSIRNPWIRRPLVVLAAPFLIITLCVLASLAAIVEGATDMADAWRGPTK